MNEITVSRKDTTSMITIDVFKRGIWIRIGLTD
jgi:hypothetical protein